VKAQMSTRESRETRTAGMQAQKRRSRGRRVMLRRYFRPDVERQLTALQRLLDAAQLAEQSPEHGGKTSPRGGGARGR